MTDAFSNDYNIDSLEEITTLGTNLKFQITPRYRNHYLLQEYEPFSIEILKNYLKNGGVFLDIGAHYGYYSCVASKYRNAKIFAVEAVPENYDILKKNLKANEADVISVNNLIASDKSEHIEFQIVEASDSASIYGHPLAKTIKKIRLKADSMDSILNGVDPDFIKIDVEGHEIKVLRGLNKTLKKNASTKILIEFNPKCQKIAGNDPIDLLTELKNMDFDIFFVNESLRKLYKVDDLEKWENFISRDEYSNLFCVKKNSAKNILFVSHSDKLGGAETSLFNLMVGIKNMGHICHLISPGLDGELIKKINGSGIGVTKVDYTWWAGVGASIGKEELRKSFANTIFSIKEIERINPDLVYTNTAVIPWGAIIAKKINKPHIWRLTEFIELDHGLIPSLPMESISNFIDFASDEISSNSKAVASYYQSFMGKRKISVAYPHITKPENTSTDKNIFFKKNGLKVLVLGGIQEGKGQEIVVKAISSIIEKGFDVELSIVGQISDKKYFKNILKLSNNLPINFFDYQKNPWKALSSCDVLVVASKNEAFGRVSVEALMLGKPVIASNSGGLTEIIKDKKNGFLFKPNDHIDLSEKIIKYILDKSLAMKQKKECIDSVKNFYKDDNFEEEINLINSVSKLNKKADIRNEWFNFFFDLVLAECEFEHHQSNKLEILNTGVTNDEGNIVKLISNDLKNKNTFSHELVVKELENRYNIAQNHLNKIYSGRIWNMLLKYFSFRDFIIKKLQQKIGFRRHFKKYFLKAKLILNRGLNQGSPSIEDYKILSDESNLKELSSWLEKRSNTSFDFFIFGITSFNYRQQRPQHIAEELASNGHRVFYIENEFSLDVKNGKRLIEIKKQSQNIYLVKLHSDRNYFIYNQKPNQLDIEHMMNSLKKIFDMAKVVNPISKIDHPFWGNLRSKLSMPVIYDCMDDHSGFKENGEEISNLENDLILNSDLVLVTSDVLMNKISRKRKGKTIILRNAGEYSHFIKATRKETGIPSDLKEIKSKYNSVIGYYGAIADWFDEDLIRKLAMNYPETAIVLVGLVTNDELKKISRTYKNIFLLGEKPYQELPNYLKFFDICTIPFKLIPLIKATNPVKIYEYLSAGKTVIATEMPELKPLKSLVYLANSHEKFISLVKKALKEKVSKELINARKFFAKNNTWEKRISSLNKDLFNQFFPSVSIILLSYGKWEFTKDCFKSLYERTFYPNFDSILIDNKSDDETVNFIKNNIDGKYPRLKVFYEKKNTGFGGGNNIGMKKAKGEYIILLNNDTKLTPGWISRLVYHASRKGVGLVGPATNNIGNESKINIQYDADDQVDIENKSRKYTSEHWGELLDLDRIAAFCWIKSRRTYEKIGGFDNLFFPAFFEDDDYCKRVKKAGLKIYCADDVFINHFLSASTKADPTAHSKMFVENKARFEKKWDEKWLPHKYR